MFKVIKNKEADNEKMSDKFLRAYGLAEISAEHAIEVYDDEIKDNPDNFAAINNRGLCKMQLGEKRKDKNLLEGAKVDFLVAIEVCQKYEKGPFEGAQFNMEKIDKILKDMG